MNAPVQWLSKGFAEGLVYGKSFAYGSRALGSSP
jgi:hypothetical protein